MPLQYSLRETLAPTRLLIAVCDSTLDFGCTQLSVGKRSLPAWEAINHPLVHRQVKTTREPPCAVLSCWAELFTLEGRLGAT
jgi:hypothetical protein